MPDDAAGHDHDHPHDHPPPHPHDHPHPHEHHHHGLRGFLHGWLVPHSHDAAESIDDALEASTVGIRAVKISLLGLGVTAVLQIVVTILSGSVALLADTIHNFSDALTAVPLWIAFSLGRRAATRRYTYGLGRVEDLAGLFVIAMIGLSAVVAAVESIRRFIEPRAVDNLGWVLVAGLIGFAGNELVAVYRIRTGRQIGSAALVADGVHARTDGFTSLAVVLGVIGLWLGFPLADPIVGLLISLTIFVLLVGTAREIGRRLLDGVEPQAVEGAERAAAGVPGVRRVERVRARWLGHRLQLEVMIMTAPEITVARLATVADEVTAAVRHQLSGAGDVVVAVAPQRAADQRSS